MTTNESASGDPSGHVVQFRTRAGSPITRRRPTGADGSGDPSLISDLSEFEQTRDPDNYRHRMIVNALALAFTLALVVAGIWLADSMATIRMKQDCALLGRHDCAHITVPTIVHW